MTPMLRTPGPGGDKPAQQGVSVEEARRRLEIYRKSNFLHAEWGAYQDVAQVTHSTLFVLLCVRMLRSSFLAPIV